MATDVVNNIGGFKQPYDAYESQDFSKASRFALPDNPKNIGEMFLSKEDEDLLRGTLTAGMLSSQMSNQLGNIVYYQGAMLKAVGITSQSMGLTQQQMAAAAYNQGSNGKAEE